MEGTAVAMTGLTALPTLPGKPLRPADFRTLWEGLDYAAECDTGFNFYTARDQLRAVLSYSELRQQAIETAKRLAGLGLHRAARVALPAETTPEFMKVFFGCQYAGLVPVPMPLPVGLGGKEAYIGQIRTMMQTSRASVALASDELIELVRLAATGLDMDYLGAHAYFEGLPLSDKILEPAGPEDLCYIQYSSGSTATPKGVAASQRAVLANAHGTIVHGLKIREEGDRCVSWLPLYHDMGLIGFCTSPVLSQLTVDYLSTSDFARRSLMWLKLISDNRATISTSPTFGYELCLQRAASGAAKGYDLSSWRVAGIGGDMVRAEVLRRFAEIFAANNFHPQAFLPGYGLAESTLVTCFAPLERSFETDTVDRVKLEQENKAVPAGPDLPEARKRTFVLCGKVMPKHDLEIRDEQNRSLPERAVGRVVIKGPSVMECYYENPEATAKVLSEDGWLDTGDLGYLLNGQVVISGRSKDLIICNGRNIWPQDIEWAVEQLDGLRASDVAAFSVDDGRGERVVVLIQCRRQESELREQLLHDVHHTVKHSAGIDTEVVLISPQSIPMTTSGKISRATARKRYLAGEYTVAPTGA